MAHVTIEDRLDMEIGKAGTFAINIADMPEPARQYIFKYGLKQCLADAHSAAKTDDERKAMTGKKLDALMRGEFRVASGRTSDPIMRLAKSLAETDWKAYPDKTRENAIAKVKAQFGKEAEDKAVEKMILTAMAGQRRAKAKEMLESTSAELDLGALGFEVGETEE